MKPARTVFAAATSIAAPAVGIAVGLAVLAPRSSSADPPPAAAAGSSALLGFSPASRAAELAAEQVMLSVPAPVEIRKKLRALTEEPHVAGTENERQAAEYVKAELAKAGFRTELARYDVLLNHPKRVSARLIEPEAQPLATTESGSLRDKDAFSSDVFPAFHGYGASGKAVGQVVYANYGTREDFERLDGMGVSVKRRIVLVRYGACFRGLKVREAEARGAAGVFIYSDPADDGYMKGDIYPDGPMRPESAIQRGSVQFLSLGPGDPTTPFVPSTKGAKRTPRDKLTTIPRIPSLPLSYGEAAKILRALAGARVPDEWQGGLPFAYHVGPGPAKAEMTVDMDYAIRPIWNAIATLPGAGPEASRQVILGNHRDAWTYGAVDPNSGTATMLEAARALGQAAAAGWKPRRTIVLASWDAEEYGLVGSTEWGEHHARALTKDAVAYLNLDSAVTGGDLEMGGTPSLRDLVVDVTRALPEPRKGRTLYDAWLKKERGQWAKASMDLPRGDAPFYLHLEPLGSGSDYTVFLDHLGIASLDFGFKGRYGVYHSVLDNLFWMEKFGDPEFIYHQAAARLYGLLAMRLASADVLPMRFGPYAAALSDMLDDLAREGAKVRRGFDPADVAAPGAPGARKGPPIATDVTVIAATITELGAAAADLDAALDRVTAGGLPAAGDLAKLNEAVYTVERAFLDDKGLAGRPWFRHLVFAPGLTTGYSAWVFPELRQAVLDRDAALWQSGSQRIAARLRAVTDRLKAARKLVP